MESVLGLEKLISGFEKPAFQSWPLWLTSHLWLGCWEVEQSTSGYTGEFAATDVEATATLWAVC